jgi:GntR family transcriptional regulator
MTIDILEHARGVRILKTSPAHAQILDWLRSTIDELHLPIGYKLPGERTLAEALGVSRSTVRQAMAGLEQSGRIRRESGGAGGAFVSEPRFELDMSALSGLTVDLVRASLAAGAVVVSARTIASEDEVADSLHLDRGASVHEVIRVRLANSLPVGIERSFFPAETMPNMLGLPLDGSLYELLEKSYGRRPMSAIQQIWYAPLSDEDGHLLQTSSGEPAIAIERQALAGDGTPVEFSRDLFVADRVRLRVQSSI